MSTHIYDDFYVQCCLLLIVSIVGAFVTSIVIYGWKLGD